VLYLRRETCNAFRYSQNVFIKEEYREIKYTIFSIFYSTSNILKMYLKDNIKIVYIILIFST